MVGPSVGERMVVLTCVGGAHMAVGAASVTLYNTKGPNKSIGSVHDEASKQVHFMFLP